MNIELYPCFEHLKNFNNLFVYSDPHFADPEMVYLRKNYIGDEEQVKRINSVVGKKDAIIFLGDIGDVEWVKKIRGYKILVMGNHDSGKTNYQRKVEMISHRSDECPICHNKVIYDGKTFDNFGFGYAWCPTCHDTVKPSGDVYEDNHLFDEVYSGIVALNDKILLSHEPVNIPFMFNIHGHDHSYVEAKSDGLHLNVCAEHIGYTPISLIKLVKMGMFSNIESIHRATIDKATERKKKRVSK